ncbi:Aspartate kinase [Neomoorella glycerini]|uniref:Aspartokinase n=1 Tax=Neomoorella glycerini TaxID=55779 RepID=A0A6I5ZUS4_9FIRM|nr:aspartate kinase [Moorella glycerini]QGP93287.1 Aspartate kinase [Moorella glycerini]
MKVLVQKFGGSSVATPEQRLMVARHIERACRAGYRVAVVVSAMGRRGAPYATDTLLDLLGDNPVSPRERDLLLACGEIIAGVVLSATLQGRGIEAVFLTGGQAGIITDARFNDARILRVEPRRVQSYLEQDQVVVVAGFQGVTEAGEITTLGRGGSDTTAAALGVALKAEAVEIFTDVDGLKTADPRIVSDARTLSTITYTEVCQMAYEGAKVIHPRAVEIAREGNIPLKIKSTFSDGPGTLVVAWQPAPSGVHISRDRVITGITHMAGLTQLRVTIPEGEGAEAVFQTLAQNNISVDFINVFPEELVFTVAAGAAGRAVELIEGLGLGVTARPGCAKVAAVGAGMRGVPGVMATIVTALNRAGIKILQSADSYTSIWCLVDQADMERAVQVLHREFKLNDEETGEVKAYAVG